MTAQDILEAVEYDTEAVEDIVDELTYWLEVDEEDDDEA